MLRKDCNVSKASNISSLQGETQSFNTECNRVKGMLQEYWKKDMFLETFRLLACAISNFV